MRGKREVREAWEACEAWSFTCSVESSCGSIAVGMVFEPDTSSACHACWNSAICRWEITCDASAEKPAKFSRITAISILRETRFARNVKVTK